MNKNLSKTLLLLLLISAIVVAVSGCTTSPTVTPTPVANASATPVPITNFTTITKGKLVVGTEVPYPPFETFNTTTNEFQGFDMDLMRAIASELNLTIEFKSMGFDAIMTSIEQGGEIDVGASAFSITPERQQRFDFSDQYFESQQTIAVRANDDSIKGLADLAGKKIGTQTATTGNKAALNITGVNANDVKAYDHIDQAFDALKTGEVDAVINDFPVSYGFVSEHPQDFKFAGAKFGDKEYYAFIVNKNNPELTNAINQALAKLKADGTYDQIYSKWIPV